MKMKIFVVASVSLVAVLVFTASAFAISMPDYIKSLQEGMHTNISVRGHFVTVEGNSESYQNMIPALLMTGVLNNEMSQQFFEIRPITVANAVLLSSITGFLDLYYKSHTNNIHVVCFLEKRNDYGRINRLKFFSFNFSKSINDQVDWNNFITANLMKIAPGFSYEPWAMMALGQELQGVGQ
jgi:hypothetical protein